MGVAALAGTALSIWSALRWDPIRVDAVNLPDLLNLSWLNAAWFNTVWFNPAWLAAMLFAIPAAGLFYLASRPPIEIYETHLRVGKREIRWGSVRRLDQTRWQVPLAVYLTIDREQRLLLIHPGDSDSAASLLRHLRRSAREALLDGVPYRQFWGEPQVTPPPRSAPLRYPLLRPEDEEEVERMFHRLKSVGHLERRDADEE